MSIFYFSKTWLKFRTSSVVSYTGCFDEYKDQRGFTFDVPTFFSVDRNSGMFENSPVISPYFLVKTKYTVITN